MPLKAQLPLPTIGLGLYRRVVHIGAKNKDTFTYLLSSYYNKYNPEF